jgi:tetratricopeptide (TPR) repeat protein
VSFLKKIFGGRSFDEERKEADELFAKDSFEDARIAYVRALDRKKGASAEAIEHCEERVGECLDRMAEKRIAEAKELIAGGHQDLAEVELRNAMETASSPEIGKRARRELEAMEQEEAKRQAEALPEMSDDDRWALLSGSWNGDQIDEYDEYGEEFRDALLALHDGKVKEAREALEELLEENEEDACFLWLEVGRARVLDGDREGAEEALDTFLETVDDEEAVDARLIAYAELSGLRDLAGTEEGAIAALSSAMEAVPDDPRPFFMMGRYLRAKGHAQEAAEVLEAALPLLDEERPDWRFFEELGLAHLSAQGEEKAAEYLDRVLAQHVQLRRLDFPPATAVARAKIYESTGELHKAADLFRGLAAGSDRDNHLAYYREAARLLLELELADDARRMLTRALALAEEIPEARAEIEAKLAALD